MDRQGGAAMEFSVNEQEKRVEIWLSKAEADDQLLWESLRPRISAYKRRKYLVAIFKSGNGDLCERIKDLLLHNLHMQAEQSGR